MFCFKHKINTSHSGSSAKPFQMIWQKHIPEYSWLSRIKIILQHEQEKTGDHHLLAPLSSIPFHLILSFIPSIPNNNITAYCIRPPTPNVQNFPFSFYFAFPQSLSMFYCFHSSCHQKSAAYNNSIVIHDQDKTSRLNSLCGPNVYAQLWIQTIQTYTNHFWPSKRV